MSMFGKLADRLMNAVAPTADVDAACVFIRTVKIASGVCKPSYDTRWKYTTYYDNCPHKVTYSC